MPELSRFFGIIITMHYNDHPPPHFHARYGARKALVAIDDLNVLRGSLPPRVYGLVVEWAFRHRGELTVDWQLARDQESLRKIEPLD